MRIVEKMLYGIGGLLALVLFFILLCHFTPELAQQLGNSIAQNQTGQTQKKTTQTDAETTQETPAEIVNVIATSTDSVTLPTDSGISVSSATSSYEAPAESDLEIPNAVSALSDMEEITGKGSEVTQEKADELTETLGTGDVGNGLTFDEVMYPYYYMLNDTGKALYRQIYANANDLTKSFAPVETITASQLRNAFVAVCCDHPELFWLNTAYSYQYAPSGAIAAITLSFNTTANDLDTARTALEEAADTIEDMTYGVYTDYEKEVIVHDALLDAALYDANAPMNQSAYSALVTSRTVCAGYARAFQYIMQQLDIPCYYVMGYAGENHAWNIVKLDDGYYNVDTTWDDTEPNTYDYFNCTDADYADDHARRDLSVYLPACNGTKYCDLEEEDESDDDIIVITYKPTSTSTTTATTTTTDSGTDTVTTDTTTTTSGTTTSDTTTAKQTRISSYAYSNAGTPMDAITTLDDYYIDCLKQLLASNQATVTFSNVVDEDLWDDIVDAYEDGSYEEGYATRVLVENHCSRCDVDVTGTLQSDGTYLVRHTFTMR